MMKKDRCFALGCPRRRMEGSFYCLRDMRRMVKAICAACRKPLKVRPPWKSRRRASQKVACSAECARRVWV